MLLTTQYLEEADQLADDLVVLDHGRVIARAAGALKAEVGGQSLQAAEHRGDLARSPRLSACARLARRDPTGELIVPAADSGLLHRAGAGLDEGGVRRRRAGAAPAQPRRRLPDPDRPRRRPGPPRRRGVTHHRTADVDRRARHDDRRHEPPRPPRRAVPPARRLRPGASRRPSGTGRCSPGAASPRRSTRPEALLDVTLQPVIFLLLFVYVFGGAISGDTRTYLQFVLPGVLVQTVVFASPDSGPGCGRPADRHLRPLPQPADLPVRPAARRDRADLVRYLTSGVIMLAFGLVLGFRCTDRPAAGAAALGLVMVFAFALCWVFTALAMVVREPRSMQGLGAPIMLPLTFGSTCSCRPTRCLVAACVRGHQPGLRLADAVRGLLTGGPAAAATVALISSAVIFAVFVLLCRARSTAGAGS